MTVRVAKGNGDGRNQGNVAHIGRREGAFAERKFHFGDGHKGIEIVRGQLIDRLDAGGGRDAVPGDENGA